MNRFVPFAFLLLLLTRCGPDQPAEVVAAERSLPERVSFNRHVKPLLSDRCFACHGPDAGKRQAGLRLDVAESAYAHESEETGRRAIVPGKPGRSDLIARIFSADPQVVMPTPESHLTLTVEEKALLYRWIEQGAEYEVHWAFIPPKKTALPPVKNPFWVKNDIDRFVLAELERRNLRPSPEVDKATLLRRVSLDLTGLPPTVAEVDAFLNDPAPNAYEKRVESLLASPHFGEHQAVSWLDAARYADTHGYQLDVPRTAWPYRDWVIKAFNQNLPFDQFITWQLAGDLFPNPTRHQLIATCFNRLHPQNQEGGIVEDEYRAEYAADRVNTFGKVFLGLTVECARCHDHKYDPISQKEYYRLFAFFNNVNEAGQVPYLGESSPTVILTDDEAERKLTFLRQRLASLQPLLAPAHPRYDAGFERWLATARVVLPPNQRRGWLGSYAFEDDSLRYVANAARPGFPARISGDTDKPPALVAGHFGRGRAVNGEGHIDLGKEVGFFERNQPFAVALWVNLRRRGLRGPVFARSNGLDNGNRGYELNLLPDGTLSFSLNQNFPDHAVDVHTTAPLPVGRWVHLALTSDGAGTATGTRVVLNGTPATPQVFADNLRKSMLYGPGRSNGFGLFENFRIGGKFRDSMADFWVDELNVVGRSLAAVEIEELATGKPLASDFLQKKTLSPAERARLREFFAVNVSPLFSETEQAVGNVRGEETSVYDALPEVMVMKERRVRRVARVLKRGVYDAPGEVVRPGTPSLLGAMPANFPQNRLGLARWLTNAQNPVFSRVMVNRFWQQFFGNGLVKSSDDFGNQGALPSHPELLDYLALHFREHRWNVKGFLRQIVLSATYRQSSVASPKLRELDPENRLLACGPSYRLSAEQVRDNALKASGLLVEKVGGPSVFPYQPAGVWEALSTSKYPQGHGDSLYRRSLYTFWKRTAPHPAMVTFDVPEKHLCTVQRQKTSTPLQALVTLNDPQFVEAARVLAERMVREGGPSTTAQIEWSFKAVVNRPARPEEVRLLRTLVETEEREFAQSPHRARELLSVGERPPDARLRPGLVAARTVAMLTLFNYDEALMKR